MAPIASSIFLFSMFLGDNHLKILMEIKQKKKEFVLFVGEGDFSYAASYVKKENSRNDRVSATCLNLGALNSRQNENIEVIKCNGGSVLTDVDATKLESHPVLNKFMFTKVIFNFPHVPKKMNIGQNRKLVELFLKSAEKVLENNGRIHVALCKGQGGTEAEQEVREWCNTWQVVELASRAGLILCDIAPFNTDSFEKYECTGFRGLSKSFHMDAAVTHVFGRGPLVSGTNHIAQSISKDTLEEWFLSDCSDLYRSLCQKLDSPYARIADAFDETIKSIFPSIDSIFVENLLHCGRPSSSDTNSHKPLLQLEKSTTCHNYLYNLLSLLLSNAKRDSDVTTSMVCCICCTCYIDMSRSPLCHLISYFSPSEESLMDLLKTLFKSLNESDYTDTTPKFTSWSSIKSFSNRIIDTVEHIPIHDGINIKEFLSINVRCSVKKNNCRLFYTDVDVFLSDHTYTSNNCFKLGHIVKFSCNTASYFVALLNLELICELKFHVMDPRIFLVKDAYFTTETFHDKALKVFRSPSLFPPSCMHDTSFWINGGFEEKHLFLLVRRTAGLLVKSIKLVDVYCDESTKRESRCYRFVYQSHGEALPKSVASSIHSQLRKTIEMSLKVCLR